MTIMCVTERDGALGLLMREFLKKALYDAGVEIEVKSAGTNHSYSINDRLIEAEMPSIKKAIIRLQNKGLSFEHTPRWLGTVTLNEVTHYWCSTDKRGRLVSNLTELLGLFGYKEYSISTIAGASEIADLEIATELEWSETIQLIKKAARAFALTFRVEVPSPT